MRITRDRTIKMGGYYNPETVAHKNWKGIQESDYYTLNRGQAYREVMDDLFTNYAFPGGYTLLFTTDNGDCLCAECAKKVYLEERTDVTCGTYDEGPTMYCDECGREIESSYGEGDE